MANETKIWISNDWYVPVDHLGYVQGPCFEGMLGCVMQIKCALDGAEAAMKIPRLLADTNEENAYICKLTEDEMNAVRRINTSGGNLEGLVPAQFFQANPLMQPRSTKNAPYPDARAQQDHVIFVSFEPDQKPRFCSVSFADDAFHVFPEGCREGFEATVSRDDWNNFLEAAHGETHLAFSQTMFRSREAKESAQSGALTDALTGRTATTWYAAVPSIIFQWAKGNLQETITKRQISTWNVKNHFVLFEQILRGVRFLHRHRMIHGDVRPANIMWIGSADPANYRLGDYGSYGQEWLAVAKKESPGGLTLIGPAIGQRRQTAFYSPERRAGNEFESADTAIITKRVLDKATGRYNYVILLGWRSALLKDKTVTQEVKDLMTGWGTAIQAQEPTNDSDELQPGDRLRLRNYLFEVIRSEQRSNNQKLLLCSGRFADIVHDSLVVYKASGSINDWSVLDLSNYVEFQQWAAASDLFSVGAVCLYSLFCAGLQNHLGNSDESETELNPDRLFVEMIEILESVPYFGFFWEELESFRQKIEELYNENPQPSPKEAANAWVLKDQTLFDMALYAANNILQSTPKARVLLEIFDFNLAHFLLFMHFVLACLHRRSHMTSKTFGRAETEADFLMPFAEDRIEAPQPDGAASRALDRLETIERYLDQPFFREFKCREEKKILDFDPRSDFQIRIEDSKRRGEILKLKKLRSWPLLSLHPEIKRLAEKADRPDRKPESIKSAGSG